MCSLRFENNLLSSEGVHFASISKKALLSKLSFAFVSLALPLLVSRGDCESEGGKLTRLLSQLRPRIRPLITKERPEKRF
jgi:hypothetical protein